MSTSPVPPVVTAQLGLPEGFGLIVQDVMPESPAAKAGLQRFDVLKMLNDQQIVEQSQLAALLAAAGKGTPVTITVIRKGQEQKLTATPEERTPPMREGREGREGRREPRPEAATAEGRDPVAELQEHSRRQMEKIHAEAERIQRETQDRLRMLQERGGAPDLRGGRPGAAITPERLLEQAQLNGGTQIQVQSTAGTTTLDGAKARLSFRDDAGEIEIATDGGQRTLTARDPAGKLVFSGPVNTPEERAGVPPQFREKLEKIHIRQDGQGGIGIDGAFAQAADPQAPAPAPASGAEDFQ